MNELRRSRQTGLSLVQLILVLILVGVVALLGFKVTPEYIEYFKIKADVNAVAQEANSKPNATVADVRMHFDRRAEIDHLRDFSSADLDVSKDGNEIVVSFSYQRKVHLFKNISVLIDFEGTSAK
ncbi:MAG TPA: DUF4845 domain-containing protein [Rhodocyclaceae bacterium]|nr:DUF4845 domain-containing protein [Rhodocyclaceae bacterium]